MMRRLGLTLALLFGLSGVAFAQQGGTVSVTATDPNTGANVQKVGNASDNALRAHIVAVDPSDTVGSSSPLGSLNASVSVALAGRAGAGFHLAAGTLAGTAVAQLSYDGGSTWPVTTKFVDQTGAELASIVFTNPSAATDVAIKLVNAPTTARVLLQSYSSGTATGFVTATLAPLAQELATPQHVIVDSAATQTVTGTVTVTQATASNLKVDLSGTAANATAIRVDGSGVTQPVSGTVTANAGTNLNTSALALESGNLATLASTVRAEDSASADADKGIGLLAIRKASPGNTSSTDGDYEYLQLNAGRLWVSAVIDTALPAGGNTIGGVNLAQYTPVSGRLPVDGSGVTQPVAGSVASGSSDAGNPVKVGGVFNSSPPTFTSGQRGDLQLDANGFVKVNIAAGAAAGGTSSTFGAAYPAVGTAIGFKDSTGTNMLAGNLDASGNIKVNIAAGAAAGGTSSNIGSAVPTPATYAGFSDGTNLQGARVFDGDTGAGTQYVLGALLKKPASGGTVDFGTGTDPVRTDPTGTTTQPVSGTVTANAGTGTFTTNVTQLGSNALVTGGVNGSLGIGGLAASGASKAGNPVQTGGVFNTTQPTVTTGQLVEAQYTARGAAIIASGTDTVHVTVDSAPSTTVTASNLQTNVNQIVGAAPSATNPLPVRITDGASFITPSTDVTQDGAMTIASVAGPAQMLRASSSAPTNVSANDDAVMAWGLRNGATVMTPFDSGGADMTDTTNHAVKVNMVAGGALDATVAGLQVAQGSTTAGEKGDMVMGAVTTSPPTYTTAQTSPLSLDTSGSLRVSVVSGSTGNAAASNTASAVPAQADYSGINVGGTLRGATGVNPSGSIFAAQVDEASIAGTTTSVNNGASDAGTQRVALSYDGAVTLQASQTSGTSNATTTRTTTTGLGPYTSATFLFNVTNAGAATGTVQWYIEDSCDGGTTWNDLVSSNTFTFGASTTNQVFFVQGALATTSTQGAAAAAETLAAGTARQGPFCDRVRVREKVSGVAGSPTGVTYTINAVFKR